MGFLHLAPLNLEFIFLRHLSLSFFWQRVRNSTFDLIFANLVWFSRIVEFESFFLFLWFEKLKFTFEAFELVMLIFVHSVIFGISLDSFVKLLDLVLRGLYLLVVEDAFVESRLNTISVSSYILNFNLCVFSQWRHLSLFKNNIIEFKFKLLYS